MRFAVKVRCVIQPFSPLGLYIKFRIGARVTPEVGNGKQSRKQLICIRSPLKIRKSVESLTDQKVRPVINCADF